MDRLLVKQYNLYLAFENLTERFFKKILCANSLKLLSNTFSYLILLIASTNQRISLISTLRFLEQFSFINNLKSLLFHLLIIEISNC